MDSQNIQQIDRQIIELLNRRRALSTNTLEDNAPLLDRHHLPEAIRHKLVDAQTTDQDKLSANPQLPTEPKRVAVIGGRGMMGSFFVQKLSAAGHQVTIIEHHDWDRAAELLADRDLVLICVPIEHTTEIIRKTVSYINADTALADITSIKTPVLKTMLELHSGAVMGLHPMFGKVQSFQGQKVVVCPGRRDEEFQWLLELIKADGGKLIYSNSEEHDRMMVAVQAIRQFTTFSLGTFLAEQELDAGRSLDFASPPYRLQLGMISRLLTQSAPMVVDIMLATAESRQAIGKLADTYQRLAQLVEADKREELIAEFGAMQAYLSPQLDCCVAESDRVIEALSNFLANSTSEFDPNSSSKTIGWVTQNRETDAKKKSFHQFRHVRRPRD